jgi:hypothetical protein
MPFSRGKRRRIAIGLAAILFQLCVSPAIAQILTNEKTEGNNPEFVAHLRNRLENYVVSDHKEKFPLLPGKKLIRAYIYGDGPENDDAYILVRRSTFVNFMSDLAGARPDFTTIHESSDSPQPSNIPDIAIAINEKGPVVDHSYRRLSHVLFNGGTCAIDQYAKTPNDYFTFGHVNVPPEQIRSKEAAACFWSIVLFHYGLHNIAAAPADDVVIQMPKNRQLDQIPYFSGADWGASIDTIDVLVAMKHLSLSGLTLDEALARFDQAQSKPSGK